MSDDPGVQESKVQQGCARAPALCTVRHADRGSAEVYCFGGPEVGGEMLRKKSLDLFGTLRDQR